MSHLEYYLNLKGAFSEEECAQIITDGLAKQLDPGYSPGMMIDPNIRSSMIRFLYKGNEQYDWIFERFWNLLSQAKHEYEITTLNFLQFTEYDSTYSGHFVKHRDTQIFYHPTRTFYLERKMTCVVQLSSPDTYLGGDLSLYPEEGEPILADKERGSAIIFPSTMLHDVSKVTNGTRYSLVAWFEGPKTID